MLSRQQHYAAAAKDDDDPNGNDDDDQRNDYEQRSDDVDYQPAQQQQQQQQREGATPQDPITIDSRDDDDDDDVDHCQSSFGLLNHSFDTLSDTGTSSLRLSPCNESDLRRSFEMSPLSSSHHHHQHHHQQQQQHHHHQHHHSSNQHTNNAITTRVQPLLSSSLSTPPQPPHPSEQLLGDISPIKVTFGRNRRMALPLFGETSVMPEEWQQDRDVEGPETNAILTLTAQPATHPPQQQQQQQSSPLTTTKTTKTTTTTSSDPMRVLQAAKRHFCHMKYLLASLQTATVLPTKTSDENDTEDRPELPETSVNNKIALRRVEAAICAFGGQVQRRLIDEKNYHHQQQQQQELVARPSSIFRPKSLRQHYEDKLQSRYRMKGSEIQWDVEENPPIEIHITSSSDDSLTTTKKIKRAESRSESDDDNQQKLIRSNNSPTPSHGTKSPAGSHESRSSSFSAAAAAAANTNNKMKYHCKRCGQLKQNHVCPYRQPLQRSIGVMVYPALNSYTAAEPGTIAAPLAKMNNFVSYDESAEDQQTNSPMSSSMKNNYCYSTFSKFPRSAYFPSAITPESQQGVLLQSPQSSLSIQSSEDREERGIKRSFGLVRPTTISKGAVSSLFVETVALKSEHYRAVTHLQEQNDQNADVALYNYPIIAVSFAERKRLSDTLYYLSKAVPSLMDDCSKALRDARQNFDWDLAVSELLTQVVVGLYCAEDDARLDGLQQYLLSLGVSC